MDQFYVRLATDADNDEIWEFSKKFYFKDEPLNNFLRLHECIERDSFPIVCDKDRNFFLLAVDQLSNIIAICKIELIKRDDAKTATKCANVQYQKILDFIEYIDREGDLFNKFPQVEQVLQIKRLSVDTAWRRRSVAQNIIMKIRELATAMNIQLIRMECTSYYSAQLAIKMNFQCFYRKKYTDYQKDGKPIFSPEYPHEEVGVYVYDMCSSKLS
ncbi:hypothetical protein PPYR_07353 [Photinus pyralis]|uniref:aralkylamine N-acetyltransferase n=3 Tax=Photinus pyralis TaxID=7054 RepID=A0A5N4AQD1_PHOPY|nr:hypothetical protein PPYR_07353 [Photinus pyralis]